MNWDAIAAVAEGLGATAVVVSLVYLAIQVRHNTAVSRAATRHATAETDFNYVGATLDPRALAEAEAKWESGEPLAPIEEFLLAERQHLNFRIFENAYAQREAGMLSEETWRRNRWIIGLLFATNRAAQTMWLKFGQSFEEGFREEVERIRRESFDAPEFWSRISGGDDVNPDGGPTIAS